MSAPFLANDLLLAQNVQPKASTPGILQDSGAPQPGGAPLSASPLMNSLPYLALLLIFPFMWWTSSQKRKKEAETRASMKTGDRVVTNSGLIGELVEMDDRIAKVRVSPGTTLQFVASMISPYAEPAKTTAPSTDLKEAKVASAKK